MKKYKIVIVGIGYIGLANSILLAQNNQVTIIDIIEEKINMINSKKSLIKDLEVENFLQNKSLNLQATSDFKKVYKEADFIIMATPTNYDIEKRCFDIKSIEETIKNIKEVNFNGVIVIKSTIPIGFIDFLKKKYDFENIIFNPEFLSEGYALHDNLYPERIIVGVSLKNEKLVNKAKEFIELLKKGALKKDIKIFILNSP